MISDETDNTYGAKGVSEDLGPGRGSGTEQPVPGRLHATAKTKMRTSRYSFRPKQNGKACGKVPKRKLNINRKYDCKISIEPVVPLYSHSNFDCKLIN